MRTPSKPRHVDNIQAARCHEVATSVGGREPIAGIVAPWSTAYGEIAAGLVHELKQPLTAVSAEAAACRNWLSASPTDLAPIFGSFEAIREDVLRASGLLNRLQSLLVPTPVITHRELEVLLIQVVEALQPALRERGVTLMVSCATQGYRVQADAEQLRQVLSCLLLCVAQAGQRAALDDHRVLALRASIESVAGRSFACLTIDDDGRQPVEADSARSTWPLLGAALSLCRLILERYGGRLYLTSKADRGASLHLVLTAHAG